ncbi:MAG: hypothetical protein HC918_00160 [Oscillatoriales cyanobacterium SM2_1_8]|nr:hypothetical protein [Oscillatoriales cyanobacterium SM2_1_8]
MESQQWWLASGWEHSSGSVKPTGEVAKVDGLYIHFASGLRLASDNNAAFPTRAEAIAFLARKLAERYRASEERVRQLERQLAEAREKQAEAEVDESYFAQQAAQTPSGSIWSRWEVELRSRYAR